MPLSQIWLALRADTVLLKANKLFTSYLLLIFVHLNILMRFVKTLHVLYQHRWLIKADTLSK